MIPPKFKGHGGTVSEAMGCRYDGWLLLEHQARISTDWKVQEKL